jgi:methylenetetrahydrofolate dehydrogenase (NADP+)/methenyltetrahydrofolate cyclohydrolase
VSAKILDGKALAKVVREEVASGVHAFTAERGRAPGLVVLLAGDDPASAVYVRNKAKASEEVGVRGEVRRFPASASQAELVREVEALNADDSVDGILVQLPLPKGIDERAVTHRIDPAKDVDGFLPTSQGALFVGEPGLVACTPRGCMRLIDLAGVDPKGLRAVVVGRSNIVGKPVAMLLLARHATVTICHSRTADLAAEVARADIVVAAIGKPEAVKGAWIKPGAVVVDVGINRLENGKLVGDVEFALAAERAGAITPVPGGVGPMTIACLLENTLAAAAARAGAPGARR